MFRLEIRASNLFNVWPVSRVEFAILSLRQVHSEHPPSLARLEPNQFNVNTKHHSNTTSASLFLQALTSSTDLQHFNTSSTSTPPPLQSLHLVHILLRIALPFLTHLPHNPLHFNFTSSTFSFRIALPFLT